MQPYSESGEQRQGDARIAHLILELYTRLQLIGRAENKSFHLPLTQVQLGEATGMTSVHVNRIIQQLRRDDLLEFAHGTITIKDEARLRDLAGFDPIYLHLNPGL
jgi:CRP-like cAMP-binding protein